MSGTELVCDLCKKVIPFGAAFVSINYNIENYDKDLISLDNYITVISSEQIFTMCGKCGNARSSVKVEEILATTLKAKQPRLN